MNGRDFERGHKAAWRTILGDCARNLEGPDLKLAAALAQLHDVRADHGDSDWDDRLNLADVVNKHLRPYLEDRCRKAQGHGVRDVGANKP